MNEDAEVISLGLKGIPFKPVKYKLTGEDDLFWYGIPLNNLSAGVKSIPKFIWRRSEDV